MVKYTLAALAILATGASASVNAENFVQLLETPNPDTAAWHVLSIILNIVWPFVGGILYVVVTYLWDYATYEVAGITLNLSDVLQLLGVGNKDNFWEVMMGVILKTVALLLQDLETILAAVLPSLELPFALPTFLYVTNTDFTAAESNIFDSFLYDLLNNATYLPSGYVSNGTFNLNTDIA